MLASMLCAGARAERPKSETRVARGKYLVTVALCNDCHTPWKFNPEFHLPEQDWSRMLSGHPAGAPDPASDYQGHDMAVIGPTFTSFRLPFGVVYTANLTPDKDTGLGNWTDAQVITAFTTGKRPDGRELAPVMPWRAFTNLTKDDAESIVAFLRTLTPVKNKVLGPFGSTDQSTGFVMKIVPGGQKK